MVTGLVMCPCSGKKVMRERELVSIVPGWPAFLLILIGLATGIDKTYLKSITRGRLWSLHSDQTLGPAQ